MSLAPNSTVSTRVTRKSTIRKSQLKPTFNESEGKLYKINKMRADLLEIRHGKLSPAAKASRSDYKIITA